MLRYNQTQSAWVMANCEVLGTLLRVHVLHVHNYTCAPLCKLSLDTIRQCQSLKIFKVLLKTHLFKLAFY